MAEKPVSDHSAPSTDTSRRDLIKGAAAGLAGVAAASTAVPRAFAQAAPAGLPLPANSGINHIVVLMMENRSYDHMLGWVPGSAGKQAGRTFVDNAGNSFNSFHLTKFQNCSSADPNHGFIAGRQQMNGGAMNGFLFTQPVGDQFPIGYYVGADLPFFASAARYWTICDHYHCSILGPTWPNRFYMHSGQTDRLTTGGGTTQNGPPSAANGNGLISTLPTIWDLAANAGITHKYYFGGNNPQDPNPSEGSVAFTALWGGKYANISFPYAQFVADAASGNLPQISYIDPDFTGEGAGTSNDDHPLADVRNGQVLMNEVYQTLSQSPNWANTLLIINYDEWGGFADHIVPGLAPVTQLEANTPDPNVLVNGMGQDVNVNSVVDGVPMAFQGFRTPCVLIGPRARRGAIASQTYDANSILNAISWQFGLPTLGARGVSSGNIATALNFSSAPNLTLPPPVNIVNQQFGSSCKANPMANMDYINKTFAEHFAHLDIIRGLMVEHGFRTT